MQSILPQKLQFWQEFKKYDDLIVDISFKSLCFNINHVMTYWHHCSVLIIVALVPENYIHISMLISHCSDNINYKYRFEKVLRSASQSWYWKYCELVKISCLSSDRWSVCPTTGNCCRWGQYKFKHLTSRQSQSELRRISHGNVIFLNRRQKNSNT